MEFFAGEYYIGEYADFVLSSTTPILLSDLSVFYISESKAASITSTNSETQFAAYCGCQTLNGTTVTFQAESNPAVQITFNGVFYTAQEVVDFINAYDSGAAMAAGWKAVAVNGNIVIQSLVVGSLSQIQSLEINTVLGFAVGSVSGTDQAQIVISGITFELLSIATNLYAVTFFLDDVNFYTGETYFLMADVSPIILQHFDVTSNKKSVSVNFLS